MTNNGVALFGVMVVAFWGLQACAHRLVGHKEANDSTDTSVVELTRKSLVYGLGWCSP